VAQTGWSAPTAVSRDAGAGFRAAPARAVHPFPLRHPLRRRKPPALPAAPPARRPPTAFRPRPRARVFDGTPGFPAATPAARDPPTGFQPAPTGSRFTAHPVCPRLPDGGTERFPFSPRNLREIPTLRGPRPVFQAENSSGGVWASLEEPRKPFVALTQRKLGRRGTLSSLVRGFSYSVGERRGGAL